MADRRDPFAKLTDNAFEEENQRLVNMFGKSFAQPKPPRGRHFEEQNPAYSRKTPLRLTKRTLKVREDVNSIVAFDENGDPRLDRTSADGIARVLLDYALKKIVPAGRVNFSPSPEGKLKIDAWELSEKTWNDTEIQLNPVPKKTKKDHRPRQVTIGYRLSPEIIEGIEKLAGENRPRRYDDTGKAIPDPHRFKVAPGEVMVVLLELAIYDYVHRKFRLKSGHQQVEQKVMTWAEL